MIEQQISAPAGSGALLFRFRCKNEQEKEDGWKLPV